MPAKRGSRWAAYAYNPATGGKKYLGTRATKREAKALEDDWRKRHRRLTKVETCASFASRWTEDYPRPRESTNRHNAERVKPFADEFKGVQLADVDRVTARRWAAQHPTNVPAVRAMFTDAMQDGLVEHNPFANLRLPSSRGRRDIVALTEKELKALAKAARGCWGEFGGELEAMILFAGYVGVRPGELFALERTDIEGDLLRVERAVNRLGELDMPKNGRARTVIVPPPAREALDGMPRHDRELLFASPRGKRWTGAAFHRYWDKVRALAGRPHFDLYELRHCAATMLLERGVTPWDVAIQLGHQDGGQLVQTTYGHPAEDGARARLLAAYGADVGERPAPSPINRKRQEREAEAG